MFWLVASDSRLYLSGYRPDVSISSVLPQALASSGILLLTGIRLAPTRRGDWPHRGLVRVTPFPASMVDIRRTMLSTGFRGSVCRSSILVAGAFSCAFWLQR